MKEYHPIKLEPVTLLSNRRANRPDIEEYKLGATRDGHRVNLELWWDDQPGVDPGWCVRIIEWELGGRQRERDVPVIGRRNSRGKTILRNLRLALTGE